MSCTEAGPYPFFLTEEKETAVDEGYVVVTAAYNEARHIAHTVESVIRQTIHPRRWIIVDDGSSDNTAEVIHSRIHACRFLRYVRRERKDKQSYFASNVHALMAGLDHLKEENYAFLGVLDADIVLPDDYYEQILRRFHADARLGVASGIYENLVNGRLEPVLNDRRSTPKAIQVFRRECFERIGGYVPLKYGGEDTCACIMARMHGWVSWSFPELRVVHRRPTGMGSAKGLLRARFRQGLCEYGLSTHPLFMFAKSLRRCLKERPFLVGGMLRLAGYTYGCLSREPRQVPAGVADFVRREQVLRLLCLNRVPTPDRGGALSCEGENRARSPG